MICITYENAITTIKGKQPSIAVRTQDKRCVVCFIEPRGAGLIRYLASNVSRKVAALNRTTAVLSSYNHRAADIYHELSRRQA